MAIEVFAVEVETLGGKVIAQQRGAVGDDFPFQVVLDNGKVSLTDDAVQSSDEVRHSDVKAVERGCSRIDEILIPVEVRGGLLQFGHSSFVVSAVGVATFHTG